MAMLCCSNSSAIYEGFPLKFAWSALVLCALCWSSASYAWNATGHRATAEIAYERLLPEQQDYVVRILRSHPRFNEDFAAHMPEAVADGSDAELANWIFQQASIWPDILRDIEENERAKYHRSSWHYINMPVYLEDSDEQKLAGKLRHNMSLDFSPPLRQNLNIIQALKGNLLVWNDVDASDADKAIALCWILHLVGDMHQPLHTVALFSKAYYPEGDRGGNSINVSWDPEPINLHAVWDWLPNRFENLEPGDMTVDLLRSDVSSATSVDLWLRRHAQLAKALVYTDQVKEQLLAGFTEKKFPEIKLSEFYLSNGVLVAKEQVVLAGHRIAGFLE
jgi:hypothetical protein